MEIQKKKKKTTYECSLNLKNYLEIVEMFTNICLILIFR